MIALYVDDISLAGHSEMIEATKAKLKLRFQMKDLGPITQVVGIEVHHNPKQGDMFLCQKKYIESMLRMNGMENCSTEPTPLPFGSKLTTTPPGQKDRIQSDYRKAVGQLLHLLSTRPDIAYAVGEVSRFVDNPSHLHELAVKRIFRYLKGTMNYGIRFTRRSDNKVRPN